MSQNMPKKVNITDFEEFKGHLQQSGQLLHFAYYYAKNAKVDIDLMTNFKPGERKLFWTLDNLAQNPVNCPQ